MKGRFCFGRFCMHQVSGRMPNAFGYIQVFNYGIYDSFTTAAITRTEYVMYVNTLCTYVLISSWSRLCLSSLQYQKFKTIQFHDGDTLHYRRNLYSLVEKWDENADRANRWMGDICYNIYKINNGDKLHFCIGPCIDEHLAVGHIRQLSSHGKDLVADRHSGRRCRLHQVER